MLRVTGGAGGVIVKAELYDLHGRRVALVYDGGVEPYAVVQKPIVPTETTLARGTYLLRVVNDGRVKECRFVHMGPVANSARQATRTLAKAGAAALDTLLLTKSGCSQKKVPVTAWNVDLGDITLACGGTSAITLAPIYTWKNEDLDKLNSPVSLGPYDVGELKITDTDIGGTIASSSGGTLPAFPITVDPTKYVTGASGDKSGWSVEFQKSTKGTWSRLSSGDYRFMPGPTPGLDESEYRMSDDGGGTWSSWQKITARVLDRSLCPGPYFLVEDYSGGATPWDGTDTRRFDAARDAAVAAGGGTVTTLQRSTVRMLTNHVLKPDVHYLFVNVKRPQAVHTSDGKTCDDFPNGNGPGTGWEPRWDEAMFNGSNGALSRHSRVYFVGGTIDGNMFQQAICDGFSATPAAASEYGKAWPGNRSNSSYFNPQFLSGVKFLGSTSLSGANDASARSNMGFFGVNIRQVFNGIWGTGSCDALIEDCVFSGNGRGGPCFDFGNTKVVSRRDFMCNSLGSENNRLNICTGVDYEILGYGSPTSWYQDVTEEDDYVDNDFETESRHGVQQFNGCIIGPFHECRAKGTVAPTTVTFQGSSARPRGVIRYHRRAPLGGNYPGCGINGWGGTNPHNMTVKFIDQDFVTWGALYVYHEKIIVPAAGAWEIEVGETVDAASAFRIELTNCTATLGPNMPSGSNTIRLFRTVKALTTTQVVRIDGLTIGNGFVRDAVVLNGQRLEYRSVSHEGFPDATIQQICPGAGQYVAF